MKTKYHNRKVHKYGMVFDSIKELKRYEELLLLEKAGEIKNLQRQVKFLLIPSQYEKKWYPKLNSFGRGKCIERPVYYVADFVYEANGKQVVEDVKGIKTKEYILKRKMLLWFHDIRIQEV